MTELLRQLAVAWWTWIAPVSVQAAVLILVVAMVDRLLPRRAWPELRAALWGLALLRLVLPPGLASPFSVTRWLPEIVSITTVPRAITEAEGSAVVFWANAVAVVWLMGVATLAAFGVVRYRRLRATWMRQSTTATPAGFDVRIDDIARRVRLRRVPEVRFSRAVRSPFVAGLLRPVIFLPQGIMRDVTNRQLEHVLLHELAHVKRRDPWLSAACATLQVLYWFHPLVWMASSRLAALREQCCDRTVALVLEESTEDYRQTLLFLARRLLDDPAAGRLGFLSPESLILARLRLLERDDAKGSRLRRAVTTGVMAFMALCCLPMAHTAHQGIESVAEIIERPPGCLQLRFMVLERLGRELELHTETAGSSETRR